MNIWKGLDQFPGVLPCPVFTIGNFDGVHLGHQKILETVCRRAAETGGTAVVLTFDPHPTRIVAPERAPRLLTTLPVKLDLLKKAGAAGVLVLPFTPELSRLTPQQFADQILAQRLGVREIIVGENFRFGHKHAGDVESLERFGRTFGFLVQAVGPVRMRGQVVSSSRIRQLLSQGNVSAANRLLGRCFFVRGRIVSGRQIGRSKTVPTLNLEDYKEVLPARGVYVTETICGETRLISVTNVGFSPTFQSPASPESTPRVECFLLDATPPSGASEMEVSFWRRLRDERKFPSPEALKAQILRDANAARSFFRRLRYPQTAAR